MLFQLHIENVAVIDKVDVTFENGLNILTGETGAGKSIIIDSINMVLGERTSRDLIRSGENKAIVEALFYIHSTSVKQLLEELGIELEDNDMLVISREMMVGGRNVCRVNGRIVTSSVLKDIGKNIVNIHGQHDNQNLLQQEKHIAFLDKYAGEKFLQLKEQYTQLYEETERIKAEINQIGSDEREKERKIDLLRFQLDEINDAKLSIGEEEELNSQRLVLSNAEKLMVAASNTYEKLYAGGQKGHSIYDALGEVLNELGQVKQYDAKLEKYYQSLEEVSYQLDEVVHDIRDYRDRLEFEPNILEELEQRLDLIFKLKRKYGESIEQILNYRDEIEAELNGIIHSEEQLEQLESQCNKNIQMLKTQAEALSHQRIACAKSLQQKVMTELKELDMAKTIFEVYIEKEIDGDYKYTKHGIDKVEFLISTNPGQPLKPLIKIASGGEMSRIMLAIKTVLADTDEVGTLIFDEIDMGVSGRAAQKIAEKLYLVSKKKQVLCITHLPQIASMADEHYLIVKDIQADNSHTMVKRLNDQNRKEAVARIIGGAVLTDLTLKNAEEMIALANELKANY